MAFDQSGPRWLGISDLIAEPEGPTFISYKVARSRLNRLRFVTQDPKRTLSIVPAPIELHEISRNRYRMNDLLNLRRHATRTPVNLAIFLT
jgi:hypothetical protein